MCGKGVNLIPDKSSWLRSVNLPMMTFIALRDEGDVPWRYLTAGVVVVVVDVE